MVAADTAAPHAAPATEAATADYDDGDDDGDGDEVGIVVSSGISSGKSACPFSSTAAAISTTANLLSSDDISSSSSSGNSGEFRLGHALPPSRIASLTHCAETLTAPLGDLLLVAVNDVFTHRLAHSAAAAATHRDHAAVMDAATGAGVMGATAAAAAAAAATAAEFNSGRASSSSAPSGPGSEPGAIVWSGSMSSVEAVRAHTLPAIDALVAARHAAWVAAASMLRPTVRDLALTADCRVCRADWGKKGEVRRGRGGGVSSSCSYSTSYAYTLANFHSLFIHVHPRLRCLPFAHAGLPPLSRGEHPQTVPAAADGLSTRRRGHGYRF